MEFIIYELVLETTRRCNLKCAHCMRGVSQNVDLTPQIVDMFFENNKIRSIDQICFSGGEPTLNPDIIIYTINKIILENLNVSKLVMVTNGQIFNRELIDAFNRFNEYRNRNVKKHIIEMFGNSDQDFIDSLIEDNTDNHVRITFLTDTFHREIDPDVERQYHEYAKGLKITKYAVEDEKIYKTGLATTGRKFDYQLEKLSYISETENIYFILGDIYITANGYITSEGMGQYTDMDKINMGFVFDISLGEILVQYGQPSSNTPEITIGSSGLKKTLKN